MVCDNPDNSRTTLALSFRAKPDPRLKRFNIIIPQISLTVFAHQKWQSEPASAASSLAVYSRFQARDPEKIRSKFLALSISVFLRALSGIYLIPRSSEWRISRSTQRARPSSHPSQFLSLTKCLPVLYFTVSSASRKRS